jgi:hypothetical protein
MILIELFQIVIYIQWKKSSNIEEGQTSHSLTTLFFFVFIVLVWSKQAAALPLLISYSFLKIHRISTRVGGTRTFVRVFGSVAACKEKEGSKLIKKSGTIIIFWLKLCTWKYALSYYAIMSILLWGILMFCLIVAGCKSSVLAKWKLSGLI